MNPSRDGEGEEGWVEDQWEKWLTHDISLDEFEDEDLSEITEITDERGMSLNCNSHLDFKAHVMRGANSGIGRAEAGAVGHIQAEILHLDLIDAAEGNREQEVRPATTKASVRIPAPVAMDTYRPKRPTTLNLFPQVPRTQDTLNNNSFGKKYSWQELVSRSSSPLKTGELSPTREHICLSDEDKVHHIRGGRGGGTQTKDRGTSTDALHKHSASNKHSHAPTASQATLAPVKASAAGESHRERSRYNTAVHQEPTEEIYLTPVQRHQSNEALDRHDDDDSQSQPQQGRDQERERPPTLGQTGDHGRMSTSSDNEGPPPYQPPLYDPPNAPAISEQDEDLFPPSYASCVAATTALDLSTRDARLAAELSYVDGEDDEEEDGSTDGLEGLDGDASGDGGAGEAQARDESLSRAFKTTATSTAAARTSMSSSEASGLSYDSVKYTLVVDEHAQLELVSLRQCYHGYSDDSDSATVYDNCVSSPYESALGEEYEEEDDEEEEGARVGGVQREATARLSEDSTPEADLPYTKKFVNVFMNGRSRSSSAESFGLYSCVINGEERDQTHRAVYRFVPRHDDELEMEVDDPLLVEVEGEDFWYEGYNMRTGTRGIFPAYYATQITKDQEHLKVRSSDWVERHRLKFLGSVQVPYHKGNDVLCAAMHKIATNRRMTLQYNPPSSCILEINVKGVKLVVQEEYGAYERDSQCSHFFQLKNISFCGYHPKNSKYFGFITKHPADQRFACHVFVSEHSTKPLAESVGKAFQLYYKEFVEFTCPTEDIYLE